MSNQYRLVGVGNAELVAGLSKLVQQSNSLTAQVLAHLAELDERQLYLALGFASLFAYCVEGLQMSEGAAGRRVTATRVCRRFPGAFERVARGDLHLCALCALAPHLDEQNATELFEASKGKTRRQIEELLAVRFPRPDVREQIRRLPARDQLLTRATPERELGTVEPALVLSGRLDALCGTQKGEEPVAVAGPRPGIATDSRPARVGPRAIEERSRPRGRELEPLSADRFGVHFTADAELRELIERARELASHRVPTRDLAGLMKLMVASFVKQEEKRRFGIGTKARRASREAKPVDREGSSKPAPATPDLLERLQRSTTSNRSSRATAPATPPGGARVSTTTSEAPTRATLPTPTGTHSRYLAVEVRRDVHARDGGQCTYVSPDGRRCNARAFIQFDHVDPFARNGSSDAPNLRLRCQSHNMLHARNCFGREHIRAKMARNRSDASVRPR